MYKWNATGERSGLQREQQQRSADSTAYGLISKGNGEVMLSEETHMALSTGGGQAGQGYPAVFVLNDQGGGVMNISYDKTATLRAQDHGHPPLVFDARGNGDGCISPTITGDHQNRITDYTAIILEHEKAIQQSEK